MGCLYGARGGGPNPSTFLRGCGWWHRGLQPLHRAKPWYWAFGGQQTATPLATGRGSCRGGYGA